MAALTICALAGATPVTDASASTPSLIWRDVRQVSVHCNLQNERSGYDATLTRGLCEKVRSLASVGAPVTLRVADFGDRALVAPDSVTLVVQGSVLGSGASRRLIFTIRAHRVSDEHPAELFGSTLLTAPLNAVDPAIEQALAEVLPWKAQPLGARPIR